MHLRQWIEANQRAISDVARALGVTHETVRRWVLGLRMPSPEMLRRLFILTDGAVRPEDFLGLTAPRASRAGSADQRKSRSRKRTARDRD